MFPTRTAILSTFLVLIFSGCASSPESHTFEGKTKERAQAEREHAWRAGWLPHKHAQYPPSQATLDSNKKRYATKHPEDTPTEPPLSRHAD